MYPQWGLVVKNKVISLLSTEGLLAQMTSFHFMELQFIMFTQLTLKIKQDISDQ